MRIQESLPNVVEPIIDPGIPVLRTIFDTAELRAYLESVVPPEWRPLQDVKIQVLKHHLGSRCTFSIALGTASGPRELIGKVYAEDRSDIHVAMQRIAGAGFGPVAPFSIPDPVGLVPALGLLLQEKIRGPRAKEVFLTGSVRDGAVTAERCALWLARFHATPLHLGTVFDRKALLEAMRKWSLRIDEGVAGKARRLLERLEGNLSGLAGTGMCAAHGSYSSSHVILAGSRTVTVDWDRYRVADPGVDVARFVVALRYLALAHLGSIRALDAAAEVFEKTYIATGCQEVRSNLTFHKAATYLQLAKSRMRNGAFHTVKLERAGAMLDEGLRISEDWE